MESSGQGQGSGGEKPHGFSKFVRRASKALKPKSNRGSVVGSERGGALETPASPMQDVASSSAAPATSAPAGVPTISATTPTPIASRPKDPPATPAPGRTPSPNVEVIRSTPTNAAAHFKLQEEKARALFAKYNLALEPGEWTSAKGTSNQEWVEKQVRVRVHRTCHRCNKAFGADKICANCSHTRCKKCPRNPDKPKDRKDKAMATIIVDSDPKYRAIERRTKPVPTMMSKGGQEMIRKVPLHRVRRTCHKCNMLFPGKSTECAGCKHQRCPKCPREPAKAKKWPTGYPGDVEETFPMVERTLKQIRHRVRWECHTCNKTFIEHERTCRGCKHERCDSCSRWPPKKIKHEPHPDVIRSLEEKLARAQLSPAA
ncbi:MAG: hypothetical protein MMC23_001408 [Stictis urceolatum]|nr:hypothetical protein [Stictis urceolata]